MIRLPSVRKRETSGDVEQLDQRSGREGGGTAQRIEQLDQRGGREGGGTAQRIEQLDQRGGRDAGAVGVCGSRRKIASQSIRSTGAGL